MSASKTNASSLQLMLDTIVAPRTSLIAFRAMPTWALALLTTLILLLGSYVIERPAISHVAATALQHRFETNPHYQSLTDSDRAHLLDDARDLSPLKTAIAVLALAIGLLLSVLLNALVLSFIGMTAGDGWHWRPLLAASANIAVPSIGLAAVVNAIVCLIEGPEQFSSKFDILHAVPNISWVLPGVSGVLVGLLNAIGVFAVWGYVLNVLALRLTARTSVAVSWIVPIFLTLGYAAATAVFSR